MNYKIKKFDTFDYLKDVHYGLDGVESIETTTERSEGFTVSDKDEAEKIVSALHKASHKFYKCEN